MAQALLTVAELADRLRVSRNTAYRLCRDGELPARKFGRQWRVSSADLEAWIAHQEPRKSGVSVRAEIDNDLLAITGFENEIEIRPAITTDILDA